MSPDKRVYPMYTQTMEKFFMNYLQVRLLQNLHFKHVFLRFKERSHQSNIIYHKRKDLLLNRRKIKNGWIIKFPSIFSHIIFVKIQGYEKRKGYIPHKECQFFPGGKRNKIIPQRGGNYQK